MSQHCAICYMNGSVIEGPNGVSYDCQPLGVVVLPHNCSYAILIAKLCKRFHIDTSQYELKVSHRFPMLLPNGTITYLLVPIECDDAMESLNKFSMQSIELYLKCELSNNQQQSPVDDACIAGSSAKTSSQLSLSATAPTYDRFSPIENPMDEDADPYEEAHVSFSDNGSSKDDEEMHIEDANPKQHEVYQQVHVEAGSSTNPMPVPSYVVPPAFGNLDWNAIEQNAPRLAWMNDNEATWDPKQEFRKGMFFKDKRSLIHAVKSYSIEVRHQYKVELSNVKVWVANCKNGKEKCLWHLRARLIESERMWKVVKYLGPHVCFNEGDEHDPDHKNIDSDFIAENIKGLVRAQPNLCVATIAAEIKKTYKCTISYRKCWEAKQKAIAMVFGDWDMSYSLLSRWLQAVQHFCPGSVTDIRGCKLSSPNKTLFDRAFWAFAPCLAGFMHCPPILSIDATFLYGKYKECMLIATALDGNSNVFPVAFAIVEDETIDTWGWFLECIGPLVRHQEGEITLISDRHPGILKALKSQQYFNNWRHRYCLRHICSTFNDKFKNVTLKRMVWNAGTQAQVWKYNNWMDKIKQLNYQAYNYLQKIPTEQWTLAYDKGGARYGQMTTNLSESFNGVLKGIRSLPISGLTESRSKIAGHFAERRVEPEEWGASEFTPTIVTRLTTAEKHSEGHSVTMSDQETCHFEITTRCRNLSTGRKGDNKQIVVLSQMTCTCQKWQLYHMPCSHAIVAIKKTERRIQDYVHQCYSVAWYKSTYAPRFSSIPDQHYWPTYHGDIYIPNPKRRRKIGRPITQRLKNEMDLVETSDAWCKHCKQQGHKSKHCPMRQCQ